MKIGLIGLGKMGNAIAQRLVQAAHDVFGFDISEEQLKAAKEINVQIVSNIADLAKETHFIWLMVPVGDPVDKTIQELLPNLKSGDIIIDGGNSKYTDSMQRAKMLQPYGISFLDCGTSGGIHGRAEGFSLMVGGDKVAYTKIHPLLVAIATPGGVAHVGPSGTGHYVKMVHNGIEYALLEAYAEGFHLLKEGSLGHLSLDLEEITRIWDNGSIIRSWILDLAHTIFHEDQKRIDAISGEVEEGGTGLWTVEDGQKNNVPLPVIEKALYVRRWSRETGGNYATKIVALLRHEFGGHPVKKKE